MASISIKAEGFAFSGVVKDDLALEIAKKANQEGMGAWVAPSSAGYFHKGRP